MLAALLRAKGLAWQDKLALARFSSLARWIGWRLNLDCSVSELLHRYDQTPRLIALMWRPLCIAALNTPPERASAQIFLNVLRDSLGAQRAASDMLIPRTDLSALFPTAAADYVTSNGGALHVGAAVQNLAQRGAGWQITAEKIGTMAAFDAVIIATQPEHAARLLDGLTNSSAQSIMPNAALQSTRAQLARFSYEPITTCYLQYDPTLRLPLPFMALQDDPARHHWGQFVFDRGQLDPQHAGMLAVVVSASEQAITVPRNTLAEQIATQLASVLQLAALASPQWHGVISEKRATYSCRPDLQRPSNQSGLPNLLLAGDYTSNGNAGDDYPATIESAVRSAIICANLL
jgi:squalene-associated FAD-dependent desaturase